MVICASLAVMVVTGRYLQWAGVQRARRREGLNFHDDEFWQTQKVPEFLKLGDWNDV